MVTVIRWLKLIFSEFVCFGLSFMLSFIIFATTLRDDIGLTIEFFLKRILKNITVGSRAVIQSQTYLISKSQCSALLQEQ